MIRAAIFDLDGTLADTMDALREGMNMALVHYGCKERSREELLECINYGSREFVRRAFPEDFPPEKIDEALIYYKARYAEVWQKTEEPYPGIRELLDKLKSLGFKIGIVTNKMHEITVPLAERMFGAGYFDAVIGQGPYEPKPAPDSTLAVLKQFGVEQSEAVFIGDSHIDMRTAKNSGIAAIGVAWGYRSESVLWDEGADAVAHDAEELFEILMSDTL